ALATREVDVEWPAQEPRVEADRLGLLEHAVAERSRLRGAVPFGRCRQQRVEADTWHLYRVLQSEEQARTRPLPRPQRGHLLTVHGDAARCHLGAGATHQR